MKVGHVPLIPYYRPGDEVAAECVMRTIARMQTRKTPIRAVLLDRLGPNVWHSSLANAMATLEELEETARLWLMTSPRPSPLSPAQIDDLRRHFNATW
jgi:ribulose-5-phosphate 4-epimerase/fuculose-1-phosphate aldolase